MTHPPPAWCLLLVCFHFSQELSFLPCLSSRILTQSLTPPAPTAHPSTSPLPYPPHPSAYPSHPSPGPTHPISSPAGTPHPRPLHPIPSLRKYVHPYPPLQSPPTPTLTSIPPRHSTNFTSTWSGTELSSLSPPHAPQTTTSWLEASLGEVIIFRFIKF